MSKTVKPEMNTRCFLSGAKNLVHSVRVNSLLEFILKDERQVFPFCFIRSIRDVSAGPISICRRDFFDFGVRSAKPVCPRRSMLRNVPPSRMARSLALRNFAALAMLRPPSGLTRNRVARDLKVTR